MTEDWLSERKIASMPTARLTPDVVLGRTLEKREYIEAVVVLIRWNNGETAADWSQMTAESLLWLSKDFDMAVEDMMRGNRPDLFPEAG